MKQHKSKSSVIIDTDPGHDDAMAIMLMVQSALFDIKAITTVAGNSTIEHVTRNAAYILDLLKRSIPIYSGKKHPLKRKLVQAVVHGASGLDGVDVSKTKVNLSSDAEDRIIEIVNKNNGITFLTLGPLTNVARAFQKDLSLPKKIKQIVMMAGAINVPGNKNRVAEFNMFVDPEAADIVFRSALQKVLIPLDVCNKVCIQIETFQKIKNKRLAKPILHMMKQFIHGLQKDEGSQGALVFDAVAAYYLINPKAFVLESMDIVIETKGEHTFGMTVAEKRGYKAKICNVAVAIDIDVQQFTTDFINILSKELV